MKEIGTNGRKVGTVGTTHDNISQIDTYALQLTYFGERHRKYEKGRFGVYTEQSTTRIC